MAQRGDVEPLSTCFCLGASAWALLAHSVSTALVEATEVIPGSEWGGRARPDLGGSPCSAGWVCPWANPASSSFCFYIGRTQFSYVCARLCPGHTLDTLWGLENKKLYERCIL